jgi:hypothetical protein
MKDNWIEMEIENEMEITANKAEERISIRTI